jgi:SAM-dependent methyltransferase
VTNQITKKKDLPAIEELSGVIRRSTSYSKASLGRRQYIDASLVRLHRIVLNLLSVPGPLQGPTLDIASGWGVLYPVLNHYFPLCFPYMVAELEIPGVPFCTSVTYDGQEIRAVPFQCDKDKLKLPDRSFGSVIFCDILEHLIVDPMWTLLEINRVLKPGGHIVISTPNAGSTDRILRTFLGVQPGTETYIKPTAIYQRHNREWTVPEIEQILQLCGFSNLHYSTNSELLSEFENHLLDVADRGGILRRPHFDFGPEITFVGEKVAHKTVEDDAPLNERWPAWLYSSIPAYRKRPKVFPILVADEYE